MEKENGVWRTIRGRRIFIASGESLGEAMAKSGKFKRENIREGKRELSRGVASRKAFSDETNKKESRKAINKLIKTDSTSHYRSGTQAEKNRINENAKAEGGGTRIQRNWDRYSDTDRREITHETLQKKLADYKAKKQSNNKVELSKKQIEAGNKLNENAEKGARSDINTWLDSDEKDYGTFIKDLADEWNIDKKRAEKMFYEELDKKQKYENKFAPKPEDWADINHWYNDDPREEWNKQSNNKQEELARLRQLDDEYNDDEFMRGSPAHDEIKQQIKDLESKQSNNKQETIKKYVGKKKSNNRSEYENDDLAKLSGGAISTLKTTIPQNKLDRIKKGTEIYYKGDMANTPGYFVVESFEPDKERYMTSITLKEKGGEGRTKKIGAQEIENEYKNNYMNRFAFKEDYDKFRNSAYEQLRKYVEKKQSNNGKSLSYDFEQKTKLVKEINKQKKLINNYKTRNVFDGRTAIGKREMLRNEIKYAKEIKEHQNKIEELEKKMKQL